jgi:P-type Mg2+ transporter
MVSSAAPRSALPELLARLSASSDGLSRQEAASRLEHFGPNDPAPRRRATALSQFLLFFGNPLVVILVIASAVSAALGQIVSASLIVLMVFLSVLINFFQTYRSQKAVERLRLGVAPTATVRRGGEWEEIPRREVVPGDVVRLGAGDMVPADCRLLEARDLHVQQAALTGESLPVEKRAGNAAVEADESAIVLLGTSVVSGTGTALAVATGGETEFGEIAQRLASRPPETEFERGVRHFGYLIMRTVIFLVLFVFLMSAVFRHATLESLLFAVALAVGLTPEFLPMITTVTLAKGAIHMARRKVIVKNLESIQNFGSIDVLCSDKTGTLTSGEMVLERHTDSFGTPSERVFLLACLNSLHQTGVRNPIDTAIRKTQVRSPLDTAILSHDHPDVAAYSKVDEIPFDFERRRLTIVVEKGGDRLLITKGAPESVLACTSSVESDGRPLPWDATARARSQAVYEEMSAQGHRVLALAVRAVPAAEAYGVEDERDLVLAGYIAFGDPVLPDAAGAVASLRADGVDVKILTGDNELVARHVCGQVGLDAGKIVLGSDMDRMGDAALAHVAEQTVVFARVSPAQKNRIILALKRRRHVVGFLGDGINDSPSLHAADVGISVSGAADVAREAADIILMEHSLAVLHSGILEGRKAYGNVMKYLLMGTSSNFGNMFSMAVAFLFLPFLPMLPTQILLNNFLYDLAQVTIPTDNVDAGFIRKPRRWDIGIIRNFMLVIGPISSLYDFLTFFVLLHVFHARADLFHTGWFVESLATQTLVIFVIRTEKNPLRSRPSLPLLATTVSVVAAGALLPFSPLAGALGFRPLPASFFLFLAGATGTYLLLVEAAKRRLMARMLGSSVAD